ncbi:hypothetical protein NP590_05205 [Methylomonas sp. SURF-2]|uniref:DUF1566 domain-containing protein n=1 Tax=Methylomonas subterranea TaxID=2952225 RepID=A0ABT1TDG3_9GAMM|nr:hypothetical protein [Methylomonas sp. SURF-2]MCQ8103497.1 hypothetical protein [Methylomonas sp. SURF-2]
MISGKPLLLASALSAGMLFTASSEAALEARGNDMYYDTVLNVTWLNQSQAVQSWQEALDWVAGLSHAGISGWRLPTVSPVNGSSFQYAESVDGGTDWSYNISSPASELAHLYYVTLNNSGAYASNGDYIDGKLTNKGPLSNLQADLYWTATEYAPDPANFAWSFLTDLGLQTDALKTGNGYAIAVFNGDVSQVPVPSAIWLFSSALAGLAGLRRREAA